MCICTSVRSHSTPRPQASVRKASATSGQWCVPGELSLLLQSGSLGGQADRLVPSWPRFRGSAGASAWPRSQAPGGQQTASFFWEFVLELRSAAGSTSRVQGSPGQAGGSILPPPQDAVVSRGARTRNLRSRLVGTGTGGRRTTAAQDGPGSGGCGPGAVHLEAPGLGPDALSVPGYCVASGE